MGKEMFSELYVYHRGLQDMTQRTLRTSILIGTTVAFALGPIVLIHRGDPAFQCWFLPFVESHRCLTFGVVVFIALMRKALGRLPLNIGHNARTYSVSVGVYFLCSGVLETIFLVVHSERVSVYGGAALLVVSMTLHLYLVARIKAPSDLQAPVLIDELDARSLRYLSSLNSFLGRLDDAADQANTFALRKVLERSPLGVVGRRAVRLVRGVISSRMGGIEPTGDS